MVVRVASLLDSESLARIWQWLQAAEWRDGRATAGFQSAQVKRNLQLDQADQAACKARELIVHALERNELFLSAALPHHLYPPLFNRYEPGMNFGAHVDNAVRQIPGTPNRLRTDVSATVFLSRPEDYDGGELVIEDTYGTHEVKLAAGDLIVYPAGSLHRVNAVRRGVRLAAFFWMQSMVRDDGARTLLFELDASIRALTRTDADRDALLKLTACYHNLIRRWSDL
jgi:PKHD-type hydroxylase